MIRLALLGCGYWGKNYLKTLKTIEGLELGYVYSLQNKIENNELPSGCKFSHSLEDILEDQEIGGVIIATPPHTHYKLARAALESGKDVLVEKPMTLNSEEVLVLSELAVRRQRILMVGHLFRFHLAVLELKKIIDQGVLGKIRYLYSRRSGPGPVRNDINVAWNLAPHDVSLANYLLGRLPLSVSAQGGSFLLPKIEDVVDMALDYGENKTFFHLSWIEPRKVREVTVVGELGTAIFDDTVAEKLRIFTKENPQGQAVFSGKVDALRDQCLHFSECMRERKQPITDAKEGYENVFILERTAESLASGESVKLFGDRG